MSGRKPAAKRARPDDESKASSDVDWAALKYMTGFENEFSSESLEGALPKFQNSPQRCAYGLYAEQLSGTAFTVPRARNRRSWLYRIRPSVMHEEFKKVEHAAFVGGVKSLKHDPNQFRWGPIPHVASGSSKDFVDGLQMQAGADEGLYIYVYSCNKSMGKSAFSNSDGDFLIVPQEGALKIRTEFGCMLVQPHEIAVVQRGMRFSVDVDGPARGYILEVAGRHFQLPDLGPIGANGLANPRDFETPVSAYEDDDSEHKIYNKYANELWACNLDHSPFDVVAWHGNYVPYKYNLDKFCCMNSVTFDHPDPSIYTVLTCQSESPGTAIADFVIFPPRWMVMDHSFRPPYYHRNIMTEYMGMVYGKYDAKVGFVPGGSSLHSATTPHGPDAPTFHAASNEKLKPHKFDAGLAFMFETSLMCKVSPWALDAPHREKAYAECWAKLPKLFDPTRKDVPVPAKPAGAGSGAGAGASK